MRLNAFNAVAFLIILQDVTLAVLKRLMGNSTEQPSIELKTGVDLKFKYLIFEFQLKFRFDGKLLLYGIV